MTKFKIGDTVRVKSLEWYNENKDGFGCINQPPSTLCFNSFMSTICGLEIEITQIDHCDGPFQNIGILGGIWLMDWMVEDEAIIVSEPPVKEDSAGSVFMNEIRRLKAIEPSINALSKGSNIKFSGVPFDATETNIITPNSLSCSVDWYQYRFDLIKAVIPALVQGDNSAGHCAKKSIEIADEVIKLLRDEKNISDGIQ